MSETSQGPGWWLASDGKWYPPESRPSPAPAPPSTPLAEDMAQNRTALRAAMVGGAVAMFVGVFTPWASLGAFSVDGIDTDDGKLFLVLALAAIALVGLEFAWLPTRRRGVAGAVVAALGTVVAIIDLADVSNLTAESVIIDVDVGIGLYLALVGSVVFGVGAVWQIKEGTAVTADATAVAKDPNATPWWKRRWAIAICVVVGVLIVLMIIGAIVGDDESARASDATVAVLVSR